MAENSSEGDEILGRGIAFPLQLNGGKVGMNAFESQVDQSIRLILRTASAERVMRPDFGAGMEGLAFEPLNTVTATLVQQRVTDTLIRYEPRIEVLDVTVELLPDAPQGAKIEANIQYRVRRTDSVFNRVYPFYVERGGA
jgi:uncharacterized protein